MPNKQISKEKEVLRQSILNKLDVIYKNPLCTVLTSARGLIEIVAKDVVKLSELD